MIPKRITIHCAVTPNGKPYDIEKIRKDHIENRKFKDIGYHFVIQPSGQVQEGRPLNEQGAHVEGENENNVAICLIGTDKFTLEQFKSFRVTVDRVQMKYAIPFWELYCHHEFASAKKQGKTCPNIRSANLLAWIVGYSKAIEPYLYKKDAG